MNNQYRIEVETTGIGWQVYIDRVCSWRIAEIRLKDLLAEIKRHKNKTPDGRKIWTKIRVVQTSDRTKKIIEL